MGARWAAPTVARSAPRTVALSAVDSALLTAASMGPPRAPVLVECSAFLTAPRMASPRDFR
eukprot:3047141-Prorocentrum_lima.AAC.1